MMFHGSYRPDDVEFLLKPISVSMIDSIEHKEQLIQTGKRHYSEMLSPESLPLGSYRALFNDAFERNKDRLALDTAVLAQRIIQDVGNSPTLISLARAGTPVGVVLVHLLRHITGNPIKHYSISIIRDRGIDVNALDEIISRGEEPSSIVFIDGWTAKGVICDELSCAVERYNTLRGMCISPNLYVLADLAARAHCAATEDDYLIPSSILNATISGLVSRSILNERIGPTDFHGCVYYADFAPHDISVWFVDEIVPLALTRLRDTLLGPARRVNDVRLSIDRRAFIQEEMQRHQLKSINLIKPGIGEATRALLRRAPELLIVKNSEMLDIQHLLLLAKEKGTTVEVREEMPFFAASIIRRVGND
jgi:hypothetical protein